MKEQMTQVRADSAMWPMVERRKSDLFRAVFYEAADAMLILDEEYKVVEANPAAAALFGVSADALLNQSFDKLLTSESELHSAWPEILALGEAKREHRIVAGRGQLRLIECSYRARVHERRHLCVARDVTDRKALEERVMQSDKIESIGRLAGGVAHDFNNLLTAILGYTELLLSHHAEGDPDREDLEEIQKAGQRAAGLTQQLLAFSRKQVLVPKDVDFNQTVTGLQGMLRRLIREDVSLSCELSPDPVVARIDPIQLEQAIINLVLNARDAVAPVGGEIRIEVALISGGDAELSRDIINVNTDYVRLRVVDNGAGIAPEVRAHLFEPFFTTKEVGKGTGLGLASVYGIVRQSNGFIAFETERGKGTTFTMHFPAVQRAAAEGGPSPVVAQPIEGRETILLVEDEDAVRVIVSTVLRRQGYRVLEASMPGGACEMFEQHGSEVDLLLTDVVMPEMNGPALAQRLVALRPELRILFISGYADMSTPLDQENPNIGFLSKPFQASVLTLRVREMLNRPRRPRAGTLNLEP
jgi:two-component system cell cycle sensor histidine kinase/response regulator CckA